MGQVATACRVHWRLGSVSGQTRLLRRLGFKQMKGEKRLFYAESKTDNVKSPM